MWQSDWCVYFCRANVWATQNTYRCDDGESLIDDKLVFINIFFLRSKYIIFKFKCWFWWDADKQIARIDCDLSRKKIASLWVIFSLDADLKHTNVYFFFYISGFWLLIWIWIWAYRKIHMLYNLKIKICSHHALPTATTCCSPTITHTNEHTNIMIMITIGQHVINLQTFEFRLLHA